MTEKTYLLGTTTVIGNLNTGPFSKHLISNPFSYNKNLKFNSTINVTQGMKSFLDLSQGFNVF